MFITKTTIGEFITAEDYVSRVLRANPQRFWDAQLRGYIDRSISDKSIVADIGANIGFFTLYFSKIAKKVYAFEPQNVLFRMLSGTLAINNVQNVKEFNIGLGDKPTFAVLEKEIDYLKENDSASVGLNTKSDGDIEIKTLDSLNLGRIDFMKIDAQGMDLLILKGAVNTIDKYKPKILIEIEEERLISMHGCKREDFFHFADSIGYNIESIQETTGVPCSDYFMFPK